MKFLAIFCVLLLLVLLLGCSNVTAPRYVVDDFGKCHYISDGHLYFDIDCREVQEWNAGTRG